MQTNRIAHLFPPAPAMSPRKREETLKYMAGLSEISAQWAAARRLVMRPAFHSQVNVLIHEQEGCTITLYRKETRTLGWQPRQAPRWSPRALLESFILCLLRRS